ncbi:NifU family protein [Wenzhouxiangella marina]|uniref:Fe/S biogenesis protein NfuA n=1 Tax=Wenzhouxiangella marina TaxID=1579979 RepID=A0A0K0XVQ9_9GAMM|nr:NifU family protein [Wenzhouxiangella marina]AKS41707.1 Fe/S biogenesis protein NfuA [Wenzhouxiangella marina]MBB6086531.1 Fe/S biogenesis protein NfuA [Wenzhouxiangella marina]
MLTITPAARDYFVKLLEQQPDGTQLRLKTINPGTPSADVELTFCAPGQNEPGDVDLNCQRFVLYVDAPSARSLDGAMIDFESNAMGGELSIRAPGLKGQRPAEDAPLRERVAWVLESRINPMVASHGGRVALVEVTEEKDVLLQFGGGCHGCGMVDVTLKQGIETTMKREIPELRSVIDATDHSNGSNPYY